MNYILHILVGMLIGVIIGVLRAESGIRKHTRKWVKANGGNCYMCEDCPDGCPSTNPNDPKNK